MTQKKRKMKVFHVMFYMSVCLIQKSVVVIMKLPREERHLIKNGLIMEHFKIGRSK